MLSGYGMQYLARNARRCSVQAARLVIPRYLATSVTVSPRRLQEFLEAEIAFLSQSGYSTITVEQILESRSPRKVARLIHKELPARFATRVLQIEGTTPMWQQIDGMKDVHQMLHTSFINLRLVNFSDDSLQPFTDVITDLRARHRDVVKFLAEAGRGLKERGIMDAKTLDIWIEKFMNSRIGTEMLTKHYMALLQAATQDHVGIVDTRCNPARIVAEAVEHVRNNFVGASEVEIVVKVEDPGIEFSFIGSYLHYIVEELLKNSISATLVRSRRHGTDPMPIQITVCACPNSVGIQVSDKAGGVPFELSEKIWSYGFSTTPEDLQSSFKAGGPITGPGMGLPLCKLYTRYLGGSFYFMSMPGVGTDTYLFLERIDAGSEFRSSVSSVDG